MPGKNRLLLILVSAFYVLLCLNGCTHARTLAFPEADGYGRFAEGGRGGKVFVVTSLEDDRRNPAPGTLRYAVEQSGPRTIVFAVAGVIKLSGNLHIKNDNITIAGQSSPGGIALRGANTIISADNVIIRYLRFRLGRGGDDDAIGAYNTRNVIIDHCSMSWSVDEVASFYHNLHFTLQYSIVAQALNKAGHSKGDHGYGGIWGGAGASFHHNLLAHNASRNPRINGYRLRPSYEKKLEFVDLRNNVIYNWAYMVAYGSEDGKFNLINSYYRTGPATNEHSKELVFKFYPHKSSQRFGVGYLNGNIIDDGKVRVLAQGQGGYLADVERTEVAKILAEQGTLATKSFDSSDVAWFDEADYRQTHTAQQTYDLLIAKKEVGANRGAFGRFMDNVDNGIIADVVGRSAAFGNGIIDSEQQIIKSWDLYGQSLRGAEDPVDLKKLVDEDKDGMPDSWEAAKHISDPNGRQLHKQYTNLEVYLNELGRF